MNYKEILDTFKKSLPKERQWWPDFFYHFTDVHNAANIIESGWIYSRADAKARQVMVNDNASRMVIDMTDDEKKTHGRLYFRPLTPTQYHNEGYKPESVRNKDINANCPVPVFFLLSVEKTMALDHVMFAEKGIAGGREDIAQGTDAFVKLNFQKIYHDGSYNPETDSDIKEYRQSEIIRAGGFPVHNLIRGIVCRSNAEKETLLHLLKKKSIPLYNAYKGRILYTPEKRMFYNNGIFVKQVAVANQKLLVELNSRLLRHGRNRQEVLFFVILEITYLSKDGQPLDYSVAMRNANYCSVENLEMNLDCPPGCTDVLVKIIFDESVMYENRISLEETMML